MQCRESSSDPPLWRYFSSRNSRCGCGIPSAAHVRRFSAFGSLTKYSVAELVEDWQDGYSSLNAEAAVAKSVEMAFGFQPISEDVGWPLQCPLSTRDLKRPAPMWLGQIELDKKIFLPFRQGQAQQGSKSCAVLHVQRSIDCNCSMLGLCSA
ncbi:hypothetical protein N657DRAFT_53365 [Parathielavia appendiculata]|uniref:Uncharacterized protein n=1 Tax=Parathielavia appendiculata TaxID=2587402 RepID=A0AAN6Z7Y5_9PEZI|nr:hypothetical protein N657DRAFT_53365 [Parathielavia appendiculata]